MGCGEGGGEGGGGRYIIRKFSTLRKILNLWISGAREKLPPSLPPSRFLAIQTAGGGGRVCGK